jgi:hypothetical protein
MAWAYKNYKTQSGSYPGLGLSISVKKWNYILAGLGTLYVLIQAKKINNLICYFVNFCNIFRGTNRLDSDPVYKKIPRSQ